MKLREAVKNKLPALEIKKLEQTAKMAHKQLNSQFRAELEKYVAKFKSRRGNIWTNAQRGINIARSSRTHMPLMLRNTHEVVQLGRFAKGANYLGKGILVFDAGLRANAVHDTYLAGDNWHRHMVQEITGFGAGAAAGILAGKWATAGATVLLMSTPLGWLFAILFGLAVGFTAGYLADQFGRNRAGLIYDTSAATNW